MSNTNAALRHICKRLSDLEEQKAEIAEEIKTTREAAKSDGFDPALVAKVVKLMRMDKAKRKQALVQIELFDTYLVGSGVLASVEDEPETDDEEGGEE